MQRTLAPWPRAPAVGLPGTLPPRARTGRSPPISVPPPCEVRRQATRNGRLPCHRGRVLRQVRSSARRVSALRLHRPLGFPPHRPSPARQLAPGVVSHRSGAAFIPAGGFRVRRSGRAFEPKLNGLPGNGGHGGNASPIAIRPPAQLREGLQGSFWIRHCRNRLHGRGYIARRKQIESLPIGGCGRRLFRFHEAIVSGLCNDSSSIRMIAGSWPRRSFFNFVEN